MIPLQSQAAAPLPRWTAMAPAIMLALTALLLLLVDSIDPDNEETSSALLAGIATVGSLASVMVTGWFLIAGMVRKVFEGRVVFHDGEDTLAPGITVHHLGGHSKGLQCVRVNTTRGHVVLASDATHLYSHVNEGRVFPITYSVAETLEGYATLKRLADSPDHIIPGHDPLVLERYPAAKAGLENWVVDLSAGRKQ